MGKKSNVQSINPVLAVAQSEAIKQELVLSPVDAAIKAMCEKEAGFAARSRAEQLILLCSDGFVENKVIEGKKENNRFITNLFVLELIAEGKTMSALNKDKGKESNKLSRLFHDNCLNKGQTKGSADQYLISVRYCVNNKKELIDFNYERLTAHYEGIEKAAKEEAEKAAKAAKAEAEKAARAEAAKAAIEAEAAKKAAEAEAAKAAVQLAMAKKIAEAAGSTEAEKMEAVKLELEAAALEAKAAEAAAILEAAQSNNGVQTNEPHKKTDGEIFADMIKTVFNRNGGEYFRNLCLKIDGQLATKEFANVHACFADFLEYSGFEVTLTTNGGQAVDSE